MNNPIEEVLNSYAKYQYQLHVNNDGSMQLNKREAKAKLEQYVLSEKVKLLKRLLLRKDECYDCEHENEQGERIDYIPVDVIEAELLALQAKEANDG